MKSLKVSNDQILGIRDIIYRSGSCDVLKMRSEYELFRVKQNGNLIVGYKSGLISFQDDAQRFLEEIIEKTDPKSIALIERVAFPELNIKVDASLLEEIINKLKNSGFEILAIKADTELARFRFEEKIITVYKTGTIYSPNSHPVFNKLLRSVLISNLPEKNLMIIGQDEAGKGEYYGPIVIASIALTSEQILDLQLSGVRDSKDLSVNQIESLFEKILSVDPIRSCIQINPFRFNQLYKKMKDEGRTLNHLLAWGHSQSLENVIREIYERGCPYEIIVIIDEFDRFKTEEAIKKKLLKYKLRVHQKPGAERESISVAAASIMAKHIQLEVVGELENKTGLQFKATNWINWLRRPDSREYVKTPYLLTQLRKLHYNNEGKDRDELLSIIRQTEGSRLDYKLSFPEQGHEVAKWLTAFANSRGGKIYFGISDKDRLIYGVDDPQSLEERLTGVARTNCDPPFEPTFRTLQFTSNIYVLEMSIQRTGRLHKVKSSGKYYIRIGSRYDEMYPEEIEDFFKKSEQCLGGTGPSST